MNYQHFLYTLLNILNQMSPYILLGFLLAGVLHAFVREQTMSRHLSGHGWKPVLKAAAVGVPLPLCSCGVLPTAVALRRQGASKGASTSFLIATPQTGVDSIFATYALLGLPFAIIRPLAALVGSVAGGMVVDKFNRAESAARKNDAHMCGQDDKCEDSSSPEVNRGFVGKCIEAVRYGFVDMVSSVGKWLIEGLIVAAVITVAVPDSLFLGLKQYPFLAMLVMVVVAVPMYVCSTGSIPIALSLMLKGLTPGVGFVLLMAGPAANFASVMVLRKSFGNRTTLIYVASVVFTALGFGLMIDYILPASWFLVGGYAKPVANCHVDWALFPSLCSAVLVSLLGYALWRGICDRREFKSQISNNKTFDDMHTIFKVKGMMCPHCKATVEKAVGDLPGVIAVTVDLSTGQVAVEGVVDPQAVNDAVTAAGFDFLGKA